MPRKKSSTQQESLEKKQFSLEEIVVTLQDVGDDVKKIVKLNSKEKAVVNQFFEVLQHVPPQMFSLDVSTSGLPFRMGAFSQARINSEGHLMLTSGDGCLQVIDLTETKNRDLMMAVFSDIMPKFKDFASQFETEKLQKPEPIKEIPEPVPAPEVIPEPPTSLPEPEVIVVPEEPVNLTPVDPEIVPEEVPVDLSEPEVEVVPEVPVSTVMEKPKLEDVVAETLEYLHMLGEEIFDQSPVSVYFDDWLVNLRQVMVAFESNEAVIVDEVFTDEVEQIYNDIEEELGNRLVEEAELEASSKSLENNKYILREMDNEFAAQTEKLQVRGKSALDFLIKNVQRLEDELEKVNQTKPSNIIRKIALRQKKYALTQKLKSAKYRLSVATENSGNNQQKGEIGQKSGVQTIEFTVNENSSKDDLVKTIGRLEEELAKEKKVKTSFLQPLKKLAQEQKISELNQRLDNARHLVALAAQESEVEKQRMRNEYEKKKQEAISKVQSLEKEIETKRVDTSIAVRKEAIKALATAVNALVQRNAESAK
ncbi:MAG: hypothetical protein QCH99_06800 [Candidatus Bathyarchaeota archaeon]|nr:hypothetical protein [Candidatus Bathyarchaeum tardum]WGM90460.1 MAG: hypothetical protein NUK63_04880 [Candidatus Bathyarchaeum tardum]